MIPARYREKSIRTFMLKIKHPSVFMVKQHSSRRLWIAVLEVSKFRIYLFKQIGVSLPSEKKYRLQASVIIPSVIDYSVHIQSFH